MLANHFKLLTITLKYFVWHSQLPPGRAFMHVAQRLHLAFSQHAVMLTETEFEFCNFSCSETM